MKNIILAATSCCLFLSNLTYAQDDKIISHIEQNTQNWLDYIKTNVLDINNPPYKNTAEVDRVTSNHYRSIKGERLALAQADANQSLNYKFSTFLVAAMGYDNAIGNLSLASDKGYKTLSSYFTKATFAWDDNNQRLRSVDFILKDIYQRGRPQQVINKYGDYINNYESIKGSSFPSGHTWEGFKQANLLAMIFPERGSEIYSRAIQYGESRVVLGAHFPTDTIASRIGQYFYFSQFLKNEQVLNEVVSIAKEVRKNIVTDCNSLKKCLFELPNDLTEQHSNNGFDIGYYGQSSNNELGIDSQFLSDDVAYLLKLRFPYLDNHQLKEIIATTAYNKESLAAKVDKENWGLVNLPLAYQGPNKINGDFIVKQDQNPQYDIADFRLHDIWKNDITGNGYLIKEGKGIIELNGNNSFKGINIKDGVLILNKNNNYSGISHSQNSTLIINGSLNGVLNANQDSHIYNYGNIYKANINKGAAIYISNSPEKIANFSELKLNAGAMHLYKAEANDGTHNIKGNVNNNKGMIFLGSDNYRNKLNINGSYTSNGGSLFINTDMVSSDSLALNNSKNISHDFVYINKTTSQHLTGQESLQIIKTTNDANAEFILANRITGTGYEYLLNKDTHGNWNLESKYRNSRNPILVPEIGAYINNSYITNTIFNTKAIHRPNSYSYIDPLTNNVKYTTLWIHAITGENNNTVGNGQIKTKNNYNSVLLGGDVAQYSTNDNDILRLGLMAGYAHHSGKSKSIYSGYNADGKTDGYSAGVYLQWQENHKDMTGAYLDTWINYNYFNHKVQGQSFKENKYTSNGFITSIEAGYTLNLPKTAVYVQPQMQVTWQDVHHKGSVYLDNEKIKDLNRGNIETRLGAKLFLNLKNNNYDLNPFLEVNWINNSKNYGTAIESNKQYLKGTKNIAQLGLGLNSNIGNHTNLWGSFLQEKGNQGYKDKQVNIGIKYSF